MEKKRNEESRKLALELRGLFSRDLLKPLCSTFNPCVCSAIRRNPCEEKKKIFRWALKFSSITHPRVYLISKALQQCVQRENERRFQMNLRQTVFYIHCKLRMLHLLKNVTCGASFQFLPYNTDTLFKNMKQWPTWLSTCTVCGCVTIHRSARWNGRLPPELLIIYKKNVNLCNSLHKRRSLLTALHSGEMA